MIVATIAIAFMSAGLGVAFGAVFSMPQAAANDEAPAREITPECRRTFQVGAGLLGIGVVIALVFYAVEHFF